LATTVGDTGNPAD